MVMVMAMVMMLLLSVLSVLTVTAVSVPVVTVVDGPMAAVDMEAVLVVCDSSDGRVHPILSILVHLRQPSSLLSSGWASSLPAMSAPSSSPPSSHPPVLSST